MERNEFKEAMDKIASVVKQYPNMHFFMTINNGRNSSALLHGRDDKFLESIVALAFEDPRMKNMILQAADILLDSEEDDEEEDDQEVEEREIVRSEDLSEDEQADLLIDQYLKNKK